MDAMSNLKDFIADARAFTECPKHGMDIVNILAEIGDDIDSPWGLAWEDKFQRLDGGVMFVAMDLGNMHSVTIQRA